MAKQLVWDNEEIELQKDGQYVYAFSRSEFESEYGMTVEEYNKQQADKKSGYQAVPHTWQTTVERY